MERSEAMPPASVSACVSPIRPIARGGRFAPTHSLIDGQHVHRRGTVDHPVGEEAPDGAAPSARPTSDGVSSTSTPAASSALRFDA